MLHFKRFIITPKPTVRTDFTKNIKIRDHFYHQLLPIATLHLLNFVKYIKLAKWAEPTT